MKRHLFFICPTDHIEPVIRSAFNEQCYFYTSLGNSVDFNQDTIFDIKHFLDAKGIDKVTFILSDDNAIVKKSLENRDLTQIRSMAAFKNELQGVKFRSDSSWQSDNRHYLLLSYFLEGKVEDLRSKISEVFLEHKNISGKIYNRKDKVFLEMYSSLTDAEGFNLN